MVKAKRFMKKVYLINHFYDSNQSLKDVIIQNFDNFSLNMFTILKKNEAIDFFVDSLEKAKNFGNDYESLSSSIIIEYSLSENDLYKLFLYNEID